MAKSLSDWLTYMMAGSRPNHNITTTTKDIDPMYTAVAPFALGSADTEKNIRRHRKDIYTKWEIMLKDPSIAEAMGIHATAALGGHEARSTMIFVTPKEQYRKSENNHVKQIRRQLEEQRKCLEPMINNIAVKLCRDAISFGDGYVRVYGEKGKGVSHLVCNEYTYPPLVQAYEQADKNIGFHILERRHWQRTVSQLNRVQMLRMKMPRVSIIPQMEIVEGLAVKKMLETDNVGELPVLPAHIGGSFLYEIEDAWWNVNLTLAAMNSQQIADAVSQMFLTINMSGMPPAQQQEYKKGLEKTMASHADHIREALAGGEAIWGTQYHVLPTWDDKQILNPLGDVKGQRSAPINMEVFMVNIRRLMGGLGLDPSMVGWADMLSGGLGNGGFISTSIQTMRRSIMIRQALTEFLDQLLNLDWGYRFGEMFEEGNYPWQFDFYSDQTAAAAEAANTKQTRMNTLMLVSQSLTALKEVGLNEEENAKLLESIGGFDFEDAQALAKGLKGAPMPDDGGDFGGGNIDGMDSINFLRNSHLPVINIKGDELGNWENMSVLREKAKLFAKNFTNKSFKNKQTGNDIIVSAQGVRHTISGANDVLVRTVPAIPHIIEKAYLLQTEADKNQDKNIKFIEKYGVFVSLNGDENYIVMTVKVHQDGRRYYDHGIVK